MRRLIFLTLKQKKTYSKQFAIHLRKNKINSTIKLKKKQETHKKNHLFLTRNNPCGYCFCHYLKFMHEINLLLLLFSMKKRVQVLSDIGNSKVLIANQKILLEKKALTNVAKMK